LTALQQEHQALTDQLQAREAEVRQAAQERSVAGARGQSGGQLNQQRTDLAQLQTLEAQRAALGSVVFEQSNELTARQQTLERLVQEQQTLGGQLGERQALLER
jgi:hypothetical protein